MTEDRNTEQIQDEQAALAEADRADAERDVSLVAMVGLLILIVGVGLAAWGVTTPGFFSSPSEGVGMSCESSVGPNEGLQEEVRCRAMVNGRAIVGRPEEMDNLIRAARGQRGVLDSAVQRFWVGLVLGLVGIIVTGLGVIRARRASA